MRRNSCTYLIDVDQERPARPRQSLAEAVFDAVRYKSGTSDVQDSVAAAFRSGEGVCQDHAHVYIAAARAVGIPARYGYLYRGDDAKEAASSRPSGSRHSAHRLWQ